MLVKLLMNDTFKLNHLDRSTPFIEWSLERPLQVRGLENPDGMPRKSLCLLLSASGWRM